MRLIWTGLAMVALLLTSNRPVAAAPPAASPKEDPGKMMAKWIQDLASEDGQARTAATQAIFELDKAALDELKRAGAKQISPQGTINTRRLDMVYSLIEGLQKNPDTGKAGYRPDTFGLHLEPGITVKEVFVLGAKHGFRLASGFNEDARPQCYVDLKDGKDLETVLRDLLTRERVVVSVNLNYVEE